jgi:hypothetical protein
MRYLSIGRKQMPQTKQKNMKLTKIDKPTLKVLRPEIDAALKAVAEKYGIAIKAGNASFTENTAVFKLEVSLIGENGKALTQDVDRFTQYAELIGLKPDDLGKEFKYGGNTFKVWGLKTNIDGKHPVIAERADGKRFCFPIATIKNFVK